MPPRPPALFAAAVGPCAALCLARTDSSAVEASWAPLWTDNSAAAKRLLCSLQRQTDRSTARSPSFLAKIVRQEVDSATGVFWLWTRRSTQRQAYAHVKSPAKLLIGSLWATCTISKVAAPSVTSRAQHILSALDTVLESMQQLASGDLELALSATILTRIISLFDGPEANRTYHWIKCAEEAIAQIAGALQAFMCDSCFFDSWVIMCSLSLKPCEQQMSSNYRSKISVASSIQNFLSSLTEMVQELTVTRLESSKLQSLAVAIYTGAVAPLSDLSEITQTKYGPTMNQIGFSIGEKPFLKYQEKQIDTPISTSSPESLHSWGLIKYENGDTALIHGLRSRSITVDVLDSYLHLAGVQNNSGETALMVAIKTGQHEFLPALIPLEAGCTDHHGNTAVTLALFSGDHTILHYIITMLRYESEVLRKLNFTELMFEILYKPHEKPTLLDQARQQTAHGYTALMLSIIINNLPAVKALAPLERGMRNKKLKQAGTLAFEMNRQDCIDLLLPYEDIRDSHSNTALHRAVIKTSCDIILSDLERYQHMIGKYNASGRTALMEAALCGNTEAVIALVDHERGMITPKTTLVSLLHKDTTSKKCKTITGATAFMLCLIHLSFCDPKYETIMRILSEKEGDIVCSDGITPLMLLGVLNKPFFYPLCLTTLGMTDNRGKTALMYAAENGAYDLIPLLLEHEGGLQDSSGWTALLYVVRSNNIPDSKAIVELAQREGSIVNQWGWSALMYAVHNSNTNLIQLLLPVSTQEQIAQAQTHAHSMRRSDPSNEHPTNLFSVLDIM